MLLLKVSVKILLPIAGLSLLLQRVICQFYNPNANTGNDYRNQRFPNFFSNDLNQRVGGHFGQPLPSSEFEDPANAWEMTSEERESKKQNPLPYFINPVIRRGTEKLGHAEAFANRDSRRKALLMPILNLILNPSKK